MRKIQSVMLIMLTMICISACAYGSDNNKKIDEAKEYILTNTPIEAGELVELYTGSGECEDISINEKGDVVVRLTEMQRKAWINQDYAENPDSTTFPIGNFGPSISYSNNYKELNISGTAKDILIFDEMAKDTAYYAQVKQVLNGNEDWHLKITVTDTDTDTVLHTFLLPEEKLDWSILESAVVD